ncbi:hypothetical protein V6N13_071085 [Hibiscus sabdariffa]
MVLWTCPRRVPELRNTQPPCEPMPNPFSNVPTPSDIAIASVSFGPWMVAARRIPGFIPASSTASVPQRPVVVKSLAKKKSTVAGDPPDPKQQLGIGTRDSQHAPHVPGMADNSLIDFAVIAADNSLLPGGSQEIFCWNVQGCGDSRFLPAAKQFLRDNRPDVVVFVEPRISGRRADSVISALGFTHSHRVEAIGFSGGIWVPWYDTVQVDILVTHFRFLHFRVTNRALGSALLATAILFGDFNATLTADDRSGCAQSSRPSRAFQNLLYDYGLRDMGYQGPAYTWSRGAASVRLDRFICNSDFYETYPEFHVQHLLRMRSDHRPILLTIGRSLTSTRSSPFRYFSGWQTHGDFGRMVMDNWIDDASMTVTLQRFIMAADTWNKRFLVI